MFTRLEEKVYKLVFLMCFILMGLMVAIIFAQVIARYVFNASFSWSEELGRYIFVWITFLGTAIGLKKKAHVALDNLVKKLPARASKIATDLGKLAMMMLGLIITYSGYRFMELAGHQRSPAMQLPMKYIYLVFPVSGVLIVFFILGDLLREGRRKS